MHTPEEAIAELEYAVKELGMKAVMLPRGTQSETSLTPPPDA